MTPDQYVNSILTKYAVPHGPSSPAEQLGATVGGPLRAWAGQQLNALQYSGSYAKETGVHGVSDVDVFISLKSDTTNKLKEIYDSLYSLAQKEGWSPRHQNVSVHPCGGSIGLPPLFHTQAALTIPGHYRASSPASSPIKAPGVRLLGKHSKTL